MKEKIKEEVLETLGKKFDELMKASDQRKGFSYVIDLTIEKTAQAIFDDLEMLTGKDGYIYTTDDDYEELKKKWLGSEKDGKPSDRFADESDIQRRPSEKPKPT